MENDRFIKDAEAANAPRLDLTELERQVKKLAALQQGRKTSFVGSGPFAVLTETLEQLFDGGFPPLKLLDDLRDYYGAKEAQLRRETIPDLMQRAGVTDITTAAGRVAMKQVVTAGLVDEAAFTAWAEAHGYADLLKVKFAVRKGDDVGAARAGLAASGVTFTEGLDKTGLSQSLGKLARDLMEAGQPLPPPTAMDVTVFEEAQLK